MDFGKFPPRLSDEETLALAREIQTTSPGLARDEARNRLAEGNMGLVVEAAKHFVRPESGIDIGEMIAAGNLGLVEAAGRYDPDAHKGIRFSTYAGFWIRRRILLLFHNLPLVHIANYQWESDEIAAKRVRQSPESQRRAEVAREQAQEAMKDCFSLSQNHQTDSYDGDWNESDAREPADKHVSPGQTASDTAEGIEAIAQLLFLLSPIEAFIINARFGLDRSDPQTCQSIGEAIGLSRERVRQIQVAALNVMRLELAKDPNHPGFHGLLNPPPETT